jgi:hypothetical protein
MEAVLVIAAIVVTLGGVTWLAFLPGKIVRQKPSSDADPLLWTIASVATGIFPGIIAALLYRHKNFSAGKAFLTGFVSVVAASWIIVGILWALGFDV